ncbi:unnamed protein product [Cuscuta epithymum]|uniref:Uncharacterized protein n=1 Tax=Cuscuta epithymum TaxID=186058 RepID=A0AAV0EJJ3_9ASTE|nr:unnamed protein product [Cuscuta epithymum]
MLRNISFRNFTSTSLPASFIVTTEYIPLQVAMQRSLKLFYGDFSFSLQSSGRRLLDDFL